MLPTNVMSFMKKMVPTNEASAQNAPENTGTFGKLKQTLSSSLLTAQDRVNKMSPRPSLVPDQEMDQRSQNQDPMSSTNIQPLQPNQPAKNVNTLKEDPKHPPTRIGACRVCLKSFKADDFYRVCCECQQQVCEDCASYSKLDEHEDSAIWRCSVCRRKMSSRICIPQDSTDSTLDVPVLEALVRRHSDVKLGSTSQLNTNNGSGLAPPRSPELRRHSDVSPASLKELERLKAKNVDETDSRKGRSNAPSRSSSPPRRGELEAASRIGSRRQSRVARQHSYDDDFKSGDVGGPPGDVGLGIPNMPRRASAYDVFAPGIMQAVQAQAAARQPPTDIVVVPPSRRSSFRAMLPDDIQPQENSPSPDNCMMPSLGIDEERRNRRRGSQLPEIPPLRDRGVVIPAPSQPMSLAPTIFQPPALEDLEAPKRQTSLDGEAIKIVIHDVDSGPICSSKRRVLLRKDPTDKAHRTRGFGMRVVGGKTGADGRLFAYIVWTVPGGPAEKGGLLNGDKILEWNGVSLIDRSFEEVCAIMDRTGDAVELLVEHATDFRMCDLLEDGLPPGSGSGGNNNNSGNSGGARKSGGDGVSLGLVAESDGVDKSPSSPTRRKLPKTPEQLARERLVTGRIQIQVWYHEDGNELVVSLMGADDLAPRDDSLGHGSLPEAYAKVKILPRAGDGHCAQTEVSVPSQSPIWNATLTFTNIPSDSLMDRYLEIQLWDLVPHTESCFLGECNVDLQKAFLDDRAIWYRLEDPKGIRSNSLSKTPNASPRGSLAGVNDSYRMLPRNNYAFQRSVSDDVDSLGDGTLLLHPDHAWMGGSRRGSSQSEQLEVEVYQLGKDFSRSLPGSRRSSFQDREENQEAAPPATYMRDRRRSSCVKRDPEEILRSLKAVKGELGRTMSLTGTEKVSNLAMRRASRVRKESCVNMGDFRLSTSSINHPSDVDLTDPIYGYMWKSSTNSLSHAEPKVILGPGQVHPKGYRLNTGRYGELKLGLLKIKGTVEVDVISAKNIVPVDCETPPDTYVKCYLKDGDRLRFKKKTRVIKHCAEPIFKQTLRYQASDVFGRNLVIMVWQRCIGFEHNQGLGGAELSIDKLNLAQQVGGWYPLFPMHSFGFDSNDSP